MKYILTDEEMEMKVDNMLENFQKLYPDVAKEIDTHFMRVTISNYLYEEHDKAIEITEIDTDLDKLKVAE